MMPRCSTSANLTLWKVRRSRSVRTGVTDPDSSSFTYTVSSVSGGYFQLSSAPARRSRSFTSAGSDWWPGAVRR